MLGSAEKGILCGCLFCLGARPWLKALKKVLGSTEKRRPLWMPFLFGGKALVEGSEEGVGEH